MYDLKKEYHAFLRESRKTPMDFHIGNDVLYDMCRTHPHHNTTDEIVSKIWLIGRSYAAAIERRKGEKAEEKADAFYYDIVAPAIKKCSKKIDSALDQINRRDGDYKDNAELVLSLHKNLVDVFREITGLEKRSLAAKYLHFHCPDKVLIYDSRARAAARKTIHRPNVPEKWKEKYDSDYADFVWRVIKMADEIEEKTGIRPSPRDIDNFLLHHMEQQ